MPFRTYTKAETFELVLNENVDTHENWRTTLARLYGVQCTLAPGQPAKSLAKSWALGQVGLLSAELAHQSWSPVTDRTAANWQGDQYLFLKLVKDGTVMIEQAGQLQAFQTGSMVLVDPSRPYRQDFFERVQLIVLRIPKYALIERGFRHHLRTLVAPDPDSPDVVAVGDLILSMAAQGGVTSAHIRRRQGEHLLDLLDIVVDDPAVLARVRSSEATLFRAKRFIAQNLGSTELTAAHIASKVSASETHLNRLFKAEGVSLMRYVWSCRLELAARLLAGDDACRMQIQDVAHRCGFAAPAHFSRAFKERYGMSPKQAVSAELTARFTYRNG